MLKSPQPERLIIIILLLMHFLTLRQCHTRDLDTALQLKDSISFKRLSDGSLTAENISKEIPLDQFKEQVLKGKDTINQLKERVGKLDRITHNLKLEVELKGKGSTPIHDTVLVYVQDSTHTDSIPTKAINYHDKWLTLDGVFRHDSLNFQYCMKANLDIVTYWKRDALLKPKYALVNVRSDNPNLSVTGIQDYQIRAPVRFYDHKGFWFGLGAVLSIFLLFR